MLSPLSSCASSPAPSTPGSAALASARSLQDRSIFKAPVGPAKRSRAQILDEEAYLARMGAIIQRDFFPDLEKLRAQTDYIEALEQNDTKRMRELYEKYSMGRPRTERLASPATFETPLRKDSEDEESRTTAGHDEDKQTKPEEEKQLGLDEFLSNNTSEDNASFEEILVENEKKHRLKYSWLYKPETQPLLGLEAAPGQMLAIEDGSKKKPFQVDTWSYKNKNYIMYIPDGVELTTEEKIEMAKKRQQVAHYNTRLKINPFNEQQNKETISELAKIQSKANDGKIGIDGKEILKNQTPRVNGYTFVATPSPLPSPTPIPEGIIDSSPIMTWGQIDGTPFRLDGGDTPLVHASQGPSFRMAEPPKREKIAMQLAEKAGERNRDKKIKALNAARRSLATPSPSPRSTIDRLSTMSPAARRLASQKLRVSVSPSPNRSSSSSRTPLLGVRTPSTPRLNTPLIRIGGMDGGSKPQMPVLTDNLLKLPQRQRAADFFK